LFDLADRCTVGLEQCFVSCLYRLIFQFLFVRSLTLAQFHRQVCAWCVINEAPRPGASCLTTLPINILYTTRPVIITGPPGAKWQNFVTSRPVFITFFNVKFRKDLRRKLELKLPPHLKSVVTLPCEK